MNGHEDMQRHFSGISGAYRSMRTTDDAPVAHIAQALHRCDAPRGADVGCGAGHYARRMFAHIAGLHLTCIDTSRAMLDETKALLRAEGIDRFETRWRKAEDMGLAPGAYDFVSSFNAVHHFGLRWFLAGAAQALAPEGQLFVYTRLPEQNARTIWGRHFPRFCEHERRLPTLATLHGAIEANPYLRFAQATCMRFPREASPERLVEQARHHHYSTFSRYEEAEFESALAEFEVAIRRRFGATVQWDDENVLIEARRESERRW